MNAPPKARLGAYEVGAPLARGGTASVYVARHLPTAESVAVKVMSPIFADKPEVVERMLAERTISQRVSHPGLLEVRAAARSSTGIPYLVMELLEGENLGALADRGRIELGAILAIGAQIAAAVAALHAVDVAHCDLKPDNVIVLYQTGPDGFPRVKVIDYGIACLLDEPHGHDDQTIAGTPSAMAPEQWRGAPVAASDVYGLGCLLYQLVCGESPFHGTLPQLMQAHIDQLPERPSTMRADVSPELERLMMRMLAKDPAMRPAMAEVASELAPVAPVATVVDVAERGTMNEWPVQRSA